MSHCAENWYTVRQSTFVDRLTNNAHCEYEHLSFCVATGLIKQIGNITEAAREYEMIIYTE